MHVTEYRPMQLPDVPCGGALWLDSSEIASALVLDNPDAFTWERAQQERVARWERIVARYEANPYDYVNAWQYLDSHPAFYMFLPYAGDNRFHERYLEDTGGVGRCFHVDAVRVSPITHRIEDDENANTQNEVWIELGQSPWPTDDTPGQGGTTFHDYLLDTGGPTFESAFIRAAHAVATTYGHDRMVCDEHLPRPPATDVVGAFDALVSDLVNVGVMPDEQISASVERVRDAIDTWECS